MGSLVILLCSPILIVFTIAMLVLGIKGDEWFHTGAPRRKSYYNRKARPKIVDEEDFIFDDDEDVFLNEEEELENQEDYDTMPDTQTILNHIEDGECRKEEIELLMEDDDLREEFL